MTLKTLYWWFLLFFVKKFACVKIVKKEHLVNVKPEVESVGEFYSTCA